MHHAISCQVLPAIFSNFLFNCLASTYIKIFTIIHEKSIDLIIYNSNSFTKSTNYMKITGHMTWKLTGNFSQILPFSHWIKKTKKKISQRKYYKFIIQWKTFSTKFSWKNKTVKWKFSSKNPNLISQMMRDMFMQQAKQKRRKGSNLT